MKHIYYVYTYENTACAQRRPTTIDDVLNDYWKTVIEVEEDKLYSKIYDEVLGEDISDYTEEELHDRLLHGDISDGSPYVYAIYDVTDKKYILGDCESTLDEMTCYIDVDTICHMVKTGIKDKKEKERILDLLDMPGSQRDLL